MAITAVYPLVNNEAAASFGEFEEPIDWRTGGLLAAGFYPQLASNWPTPNVNTGIELDASGNLLGKSAQGFVFQATAGKTFSFQIGGSEYLGISSAGVLSGLTAAIDTSTTQLATTAFVTNQASAVNPSMNGTVAIGTSKRYARADHVHASDTSRAAVGQTMYLGTTAVAINRASAAGLSLAGVSIDGSAGSVPWTGVSGRPTALSSFTNDSGFLTAIPTASATVLGGIKVGANLSIDGAGVLSATGGSSYTLPVATAAVLGGVKIGANVSVDGTGVISVAAPYTHPANHPPSIITQDASNRFVTDTEKSTWNGKQNALGFTPPNIALANIYQISNEAALSVTVAGWYTIATVAQNVGRARGHFIIYDTDGGKHNFAEVIASHSYGQSQVQLLAGDRFGTITLDKIRILYDSNTNPDPDNRTYGGAKLQVYCANPPFTLRAVLIGDQIVGWNNWTLQTPVQEDAPTGWAQDPLTYFTGLTDDVFPTYALNVTKDATIGGNLTLPAGGSTVKANNFDGQTSNSAVYFGPTLASQINIGNATATTNLLGTVISLNGIGAGAALFGFTAVNTRYATKIMSSINPVLDSSPSLMGYHMFDTSFANVGLPLISFCVAGAEKANIDIRGNIQAPTVITDYGTQQTVFTRSSGVITAITKYQGAGRASTDIIWSATINRTAGRITSVAVSYYNLTGSVQRTITKTLTNDANGALSYIAMS